MDAALISLLLVLALVGGVAAAFFALTSRNKQESAQGTQGAEQDEDEEVDIVPQARARGANARLQGRNIRRRGQAAAAQQQQQVQQQVYNDSEDESEGDSDEDAGGPQGGKKSKKQRNREARREAQEAQRAARQEREARAGQLSHYEEMRRQKDAEREAKEKAAEEEAARIAAERARQEEEEAAKWMGQITVEQAGTEEVDDGGDGSGVLSQFVDYLQARKTVPLEQLAADFRMRTSDVVDRLQGLEAMGRITGIMDERGKYIYISMDEMKAVADYLTQKGRVAITDLAVKSSTLIDLEPKAASAAALHGESVLDFDSMLDAGEAAAA